MADQTLRAQPVRSSRARRTAFRLLVVSAIVLLLFGVPWWTLFVAGARWPTPVLVIGTFAFAAAVVALLATMVWGHGRRHWDWAAVTATSCWVLSGCSSSGQCCPRCFGWLWGCAASGIRRGRGSSRRGRRGSHRAARVGPFRGDAGTAGQARRRDDSAAWRGLDGLRVAIITDTHYGPLDRAGWSAAMVDRVNELDADVVCHLGDIADGTADVREAQAAPLARVHATHARVYVTGNHEYFSEVLGWLEYMQGIGWETLRNGHIVVERGGDGLVIAGVDDVTARGSGLQGHGADVGAALVGADPTLPVLLLAHQPKQVAHAVAAGSICNSPGTPTAGRSGRSTSSSGSISPSCTA